MCCKLLSVEELSLPPLSWCPNCNVKMGCNIYEQRPTECRQFYCEYLLDPSLDDHWKPSRCKIVVVREDDQNAIVIHVNSDRPHAWREEPFYTEICRWAEAAASTQRQVIVWQGNSKVVVTGRSTLQRLAEPA